MARKPPPRPASRRRPTDQRLIDRLKKDLDATNGYLRESEIRVRDLETRLRDAMHQVDRLMSHGRAKDQRLAASEQARHDAVVALQAVADLSRQAGNHSRKGGHVMEAPHVRPALEQSARHASSAMANLADRGEGVEYDERFEREGPYR